MEKQRSHFQTSTNSFSPPCTEEQTNYHCGFILHVQVLKNNPISLYQFLLVLECNFVDWRGRLTCRLRGVSFFAEGLCRSGTVCFGRDGWTHLRGWRLRDVPHHSQILCSYSLLVLGWSVRMPCFYWPFLLLNPLLMCLTAVFCTYPAIDTILAPIVYASGQPLDFVRFHSKQQLLLQVTHSLRIMELVSSVCAIFLLGYFQSIVFRAHNWQRKQNNLDQQLIIIGDQTP